ncbi:uncharacterized protein [Parasteatoda tepidariorum]|uniref:uncharacterized protein n=1 Tax=Parasteatoda tepidariorum TaxID=114398 RepID=UPI00077FB63C|nr:uncharacterized protein LOC107452871 [Parasteatoda tepidariorum]
MQRYNNLSECIKMCDRILRTNPYPRSDLMKPEVSQVQNIQILENSSTNLLFLKTVNAFHPSRTIIVQNFLPEAEVHVRSFIAMFGIVEICEVIGDDALSALAVVQYKSKTSAADSLLAMPNCQIRGNNLVVNLLWNGPYEHISSITSSVIHSPPECAEKRVVCVGHLPRSITKEAILRKCENYGVVENVRVQPQEQGAFVFVVFQSALSAAVATYCLRNSSLTSAALMLGYGENGSPVLLGPAKVKPLDQYPVPLSAFDVRCVCTRFLDYSRMKGLLINLQRKLPVHHFYRPGSPDYCLRIPTTQIKGVSLFLEILLFDGNFVRNGEDITEMAYQLCTHKYLFRFSVDFGLHKPVMSHDDRNFRATTQYVKWNSLFVLDLQICYPWGHSDPMIEPRIQGMNHIYSDIDSKAFEEGRSSWFGTVLRHSVGSLTTGDAYPLLHRNKVNYLINSDLPFIRIVGSYEDINNYQIPIHAYSDLQPSFKTNQQNS